MITLFYKLEYRNKYKYKCPIKECESSDIFRDRKGYEFLCMTCGFYWYIRKKNEK